MFRGKESSNRIELSRLVQDIEFLCFGLPAALGVGGLGGWGWEVVGGAPYTHAHARVVNMIISCKWPPPLGEYLGIPYDVICVCVRVRVHVHVGGMHPLTTPHPHPPTPPSIIQNSIALELIEIFQFCLKI